MAGLMEVLDPGAATTVQDAGRYGYRRLGVPPCGALDPLWLACANALAGNAAAVAGLECRVSGPRLRVTEGMVCLALAAPGSALIERAGGERENLPPWHSATLARGDTLRLGAIGGGVAYLAFRGGLEVPLQLGSRATYAAAALGGVDGRGLRAGDRLACAGIPPGMQRRQAAPRLHEDGPLRLLAGPQAEHFTDASHATLCGAEFVVSRHTDRMGMRLEGPRLAHRPERGADIASDGTTPGAIQVPADGRPIVLLADCQTVGGYAKIATVIRADLPRLAHLLPGARLRFALVDHATAAQALQRQAHRLVTWLADIASLTDAAAADSGWLLSANLVSGIVDALDERPATPGHRTEEPP